MKTFSRLSLSASLISAINALLLKGLLVVHIAEYGFIYTHSSGILVLFNVYLSLLCSANLWVSWIWLRGVPFHIFIFLDMCP